jgi:hypothetical protein
MAAVALWNSWLFFRPQMGVQILPSIRGVRVPHDRVAGTLELLNGLVKQGPVTIVASVSSSVPWRVVSYYYQKTQLAVLLSDPQPGSKAQPSYYLLRGGQLVRAGSEPITLPGCGKLVWLRSLGSREALRTTPAVTQRSAGDIVIADLKPGITIQLDPYTMSTDYAGCPEVMSAVR